MPPRKKKSAQPEVSADALRGAPAGRREPRRYRMVSYADGSLRPVRCVHSAQDKRAQAVADWLGAAPELSPMAHVRSMESLLAEVVEGLELRQEELAPEVLAAAWLRAVGESLATHAALMSVAGGQASIRTNHPLVRTELMRLKPQIIRVLNAELGEGSVKKVRIVHG